VVNRLIGVRKVITPEARARLLGLTVTPARGASVTLRGNEVVIDPFVQSWPLGVARGCARYCIALAQPRTRKNPRAARALEDALTRFFAAPKSTGL
jgi:hypothetical protein